MLFTKRSNILDSVDKVLKCENKLGRFKIIDNVIVCCGLDWIGLDCDSLSP